MQRSHRGRDWLRLGAWAILALCTTLAQAADIRVVSSGGFAAALRALAPGFEHDSGHHLILDWGPSMGETPQAIPARLARGESIDVVIMVGNALDGLIQRGQVQDEGHALLARSRIALAVKAGAPHPDISSVAALRATLLQARSIAYSDSASGVFLATVLFPRLGVESALRTTARQIPAEPVGQVVARGEAELGFQQLSELQAIAGIDIVGLLPDAAQQVTPFSAGVVTRSHEAGAAQALIRYLTSPAAIPLIRQTGLDPASATSAQ